MVRRILLVIAGLFSVLYLINPGAGIFEILPDNLPLIGNLDEALATALLIGVMREFGIDLTRWFPKKSTVTKNDGGNANP